mgnify:CR=1 FL=1
MNPRFLEGATWGFPGEPVAHIETHAAHVFLVSSWAFKVKKAIVLPYLDFSTLERRRAVLARELEVNRRFAPQIYDRVIEVEGEPVLVMHRFDNGSVFRQLIGTEQRTRVLFHLAPGIGRVAASDDQRCTAFGALAIERGLALRGIGWGALHREQGGARGLKRCPVDR